MAISKLKQIKQIVKTHPVTDPRGALIAIEMTLAQKNPTKKQKPVFRIDVFDHEDTIEVRLTGVDDVSPCHVRAARQAIEDFIKSKDATILGDIFAKLHAGAPKVSDTERNSTQGAD